MKNKAILLTLICFWISKVTGQVTLSGTSSNDGTYTLGCYSYSYNFGEGATGTITACPNSPDVGTHYYSKGTANAGYMFSSNTQIIVRKNNVWELQSGSTNFLNSYSMSSRLYHTKFKYDTQEPPCTAIWINDADGSEVILNSSGVCENTANTISSITTPVSICAGESMTVSFTTTTTAASYTVELLWDYSYQYLCGGTSGSGTTVLNTIVTTTNSASIPIQATFSLVINSSGCKTGSGCGSQNRCDNYRIRITPVGATQGVSKSLTKVFSIADCPPPCLSLLNLSSSNTPTDDISSGTIIKQVNSSNGVITATNKITGTATKVTYQAKNIQLNAGFKADNGTVFKAEVGGCM